MKFTLTHTDPKKFTIVQLAPAEDIVQWNSIKTIPTQILYGAEMIDQANWYKAAYWDWTFMANWSQSGVSLASDGTTGGCIRAGFWTIGKIYRIVYTCVLTSGTFNGPNDGIAFNGTSVISETKITTFYIPQATGLYLRSVDFLGTVTALSVKEVISDPIPTASTTPGLFTFHNQNDQRIFQSKGYIKRLQFNLATITGLTSCKFYIWKTGAGGLYDVRTSLELISRIASGTNTLDLSPPLYAEEGDHIGFNFIASSPTSFMYGYPILNSLLTRAGAITVTDFDWTAQTLSNVMPVIHTFGRPPKIVCIGDSVMESSYECASLLEEINTFVAGASWIAKMATLNFLITYQAKGLGGESMYPNIQARFNRDVILIKPKIAIINGGVNDYSGHGNKTNFLTAFEDVLDQCTAANIIPVVWSMTPDERVSNANYPTRDIWNTDLQALVATYSRARWIDLVTLLGIFRAGGAAGNLWDWNPIYRREAYGSGLHPNAAGDTAIANYTYSRIIDLI